MDELTLSKAAGGRIVVADEQDAVSQWWNAPVRDYYVRSAAGGDCIWCGLPDSGEPRVRLQSVQTNERVAYEATCCVDCAESLAETVDDTAHRTPYEYNVAETAVKLCYTAPTDCRHNAYRCCACCGRGICSDGRYTVSDSGPWIHGYCWPDVADALTTTLDSVLENYAGVLLTDALVQ